MTVDFLLPRNYLVVFFNFLLFFRTEIYVLDIRGGKDSLRPSSFSFSTAPRSNYRRTHAPINVMRAPFSCSSHNHGMTLDWGSQSINDHQPLPPPWASYFNFWPSSCWVSMPDGPTETDLRMTRTPASSVAAPSTSRITTTIIITIISRTHPICRTSSPGSENPTLCWFWRMIKMLNWVRNDVQDYSNLSEAEPINSAFCKFLNFSSRVQD